MAVMFFCPRWGCEVYPWEAFLRRVRDVGYDGVEWAVPGNVSTAELDRVFSLADQTGVPVIVQHFDTDVSDFGRHRDAFGKWLEKVGPYPYLKLNTQTGKDYFSMAQNLELIGLADALGCSRGREVVHETHRGKFSFAAHVSAGYLQELPSLRITLDISHWLCVSESYLEGQEDAVELAITRTDHLHARVGFPEGPQLVDPRCPEWEQALQQHLHWWDAVEARCRSERYTLTVTSEFGPFPYMVFLPGMGEPIADQWAINCWMMEILRERWRGDSKLNKHKQ